MLTRLLEAGTIAPVIDSSYGLEEARAAFERFQSITADPIKRCPECGTVASRPAGAEKEHPAAKGESG